MSKSKIIFQLSGSIACFKACALLSALVKEGHEIEVVATASALKFVGEATLEGLTGRRVHTNTFEAGSYMQHIHLVRWADLIVLAPATANTLNKMAAGIGDDLVTTLFLAHEFNKPYLVAPAMNQSMYAHPATRSSLEKLADWGVQVLATGTGALACGENGEGRMLEPEEILAAIHQALSSSAKLVATATKKILITSGGTQEPIDGVRSLTNTSTGRTGAELATWFASQGADVTLLHAANAVLPAASPQIKRHTFTSFKSLETELSRLLTNFEFDAVIHLAAVADYSVSEIIADGAVLAAPVKGKVASADSLTLNLKKNPKLIDSIRKLSKNSDVQLIAFKLTNTHDFDERQTAIESLAAHAQPNFIVHNDVTEMTATLHPFEIYERDANLNMKTSVHTLYRANSANALAEKLYELIGGAS